MGADGEGKARNGKRRVGNSSVCITCWRKGAVGEEIKRKNHSGGERPGISQLKKWEGSGVEEEMTAKASVRSPAGQGTQRCLSCQDLRVTSYVTGKVNFPDWQQNHCFYPGPLKLKPVMIPYTSEMGEARQVETNISLSFVWKIPTALLISDNACNQQNSFIFKVSLSCREWICFSAGWLHSFCNNGICLTSEKLTMQMPPCLGSTFKIKYLLPLNWWHDCKKGSIRVKTFFKTHCNVKHLHVMGLSLGARLYRHCPDKGKPGIIVWLCGMVLALLLRAPGAGCSEGCKPMESWALRESCTVPPHGSDSCWCKRCPDNKCGGVYNA